MGIESHRAAHRPFLRAVAGLAGLLFTVAGCMTEVDPPCVAGQGEAAGCAGENVCHVESGYCVECLSSAQCGGQVCRDYICVDPVDGDARGGDEVEVEVDVETDCADGQCATDDGCLALDVARPITVVGSAGLRVEFSINRCDGRPAPLLEEAQVRIINDERGIAFDGSPEGGSRSRLGLPDSFQLFSVLVLDFSDSIFANGAQDDVVAGVTRYLQQLLVPDDADPERLAQVKKSHQVAIVSLGRPDAVRLVRPFTDDPADITASLNDLIDGGALGSTDLYNAYSLALRTAAMASADSELIRRAVIVLTDGQHEAGDAENLRRAALDARRAHLDDVEIYTIGIRGDYNESLVRELASSPQHFAEAGADEIAEQFRTIATNVAQLANRNYVVGVCTPVALGEPTLTIAVETGDFSGRATVPYPTDMLNGDTTRCDPEQIIGGN